MHSFDKSIVVILGEAGAKLSGGSQLDIVLSGDIGNQTQVVDLSAVIPGDGTQDDPEEGDEELLEFVFNRARTLTEVKDAIERIFKGTYGICELTRKPIALERLSAIPYTRYSLEGQKQAEALRSDAFSSEEEAFDMDTDREGLSYTPDELSDE